MKRKQREEENRGLFRGMDDKRDIGSEERSTKPQSTGHKQANASGQNSMASGHSDLSTPSRFYQAGLSDQKLFHHFSFSLGTTMQPKRKSKKAAQREGAAVERQGSGPECRGTTRDTAEEQADKAEQPDSDRELAPEQGKRELVQNKRAVGVRPDHENEGVVRTNEPDQEKG